MKYGQATNSDQRISPALLCALTDRFLRFKLEMHRTRAGFGRLNEFGAPVLMLLSSVPASPNHLRLLLTMSLFLGTSGDGVNERTKTKEWE